MNIVIIAIVTSIIVSALICFYYTKWWMHNLNVWVEEFIKNEMEDKRRYMKEFVEDVKKEIKNKYQ